MTLTQNNQRQKYLGEKNHLLLQILAVIDTFTLFFTSERVKKKNNNNNKKIHDMLTITSFFIQVLLVLGQSVDERGKNKNNNKKASH